MFQHIISNTVLVNVASIDIMIKLWIFVAMFMTSRNKEFCASRTIQIMDITKRMMLNTGINIK